MGLIGRDMVRSAITAFNGVKGAKPVVEDSSVAALPSALREQAYNLQRQHEDVLAKRAQKDSQQDASGEVSTETLQSAVPLAAHKASPPTQLGQRSRQEAYIAPQQNATSSAQEKSEPSHRAPNHQHRTEDNT